MNPQDIMDQIKKAQRELSELNTKLFRYGQEKKYAEQQYKIQLSNKRLELDCLRSLLTWHRVELNNS